MPLLARAAPSRLVKPSLWSISPGLVDPAWRWAWDDVSFWLPFWSGGGVPRVYSATRLGASLVDAPVWGSDRLGRRLRTDGTNDAIRLGAGVGLDTLVGNGCTIFVACRMTAATSFGDAFLGDADSAGASSNYSVRLYEFSGQLRFQWRTSFSNYQIITDTITGVGSFLCFAAILQTPGTAVLLTQKPDASGVRRWTQSSLGTIAAGTDLHLGRPGAYANDYLAADWFTVGIVPWPVSEAYALQWLADPFGPFRRARRRIGFVFSTGAQTVNLTVALVSWATPDILPALGAVAVQLTTTSASWTVPDLTAVPGAITAALTSAIGSWTAPDVTTSPGAATVAVGAVIANWTAPSVTPAPGAISAPLTAAVVTWATLDVTPSVGGQTVPLDPAIVAWTVPSVTPVAGAVTIPLSAAAATWNAPALFPRGAFFLLPPFHARGSNGVTEAVGSSGAARASGDAGVVSTEP